MSTSQERNNLRKSQDGGSLKRDSSRNLIKTNTNLQPLAKQRPLTSQRNPKLRQRLVDVQP